MYLVKEGNKAFRGWLLFANTREKIKLVLVVVLARSRLDSNLKVSNNKIGNEKKKQQQQQTNKQQLQRQQKTNKKKRKTKQNKSGGVREFLGGSEKEKLRSIILR